MTSARRARGRAPGRAGHLDPARSDLRRHPRPRRRTGRPERGRPRAAAGTRRRHPGAGAGLAGRRPRDARRRRPAGGGGAGPARRARRRVHPRRPDVRDRDQPPGLPAAARSVRRAGRGGLPGPAGRVPGVLRRPGPAPARQLAPARRADGAHHDRVPGPVPGAGNAVPPAADRRPRRAPRPAGGRGGAARARPLPRVRRDRAGRARPSRPRAGALLARRRRSALRGVGAHAHDHRPHARGAAPAGPRRARRARSRVHRARRPRVRADRPGRGAPPAADRRKPPLA